MAFTSLMGSSGFCAPDISTSDFELLFDYRRGGEMTLSAFADIPFSPLRSSSLHGAPLRFTTSLATRPAAICATCTASNVSPLLHLDEKEAEALFLQHPELELAPPESLRSRVLALQSVGIDDSRSAVSWPGEILLAPELGPFLEFARDELKGLKPAKLERLLTTTHPKFLTGIAARVTRLMEHGVPGEKLGHLLNHLAGLGRPSADDSESGPSRPADPRVEFLAELGAETRQPPRPSPNCLPSYPTPSSTSVPSGVLEIRGSLRRGIFKIALVYPNIFSVSKESWGLGSRQPLQEADLPGEDRIQAPDAGAGVGGGRRPGRAARTCRVLGLFFSHGLSCDDVLGMSKKHPQVLQYNHASLEKKMEFLIGYMGTWGDTGLPGIPRLQARRPDQERYEIKGR
ncbi:mTERF [Musa troglodytarum]|uniref:mTERF n=1 Tax=Musa troglodytarum TaxID=320322 RepID=A0A9E7G2L5_9LILI|nr:mTERF [Musa troglodytarum]